MNKIGLTSDITKAFLQILINEEDRKFFKFLWWENDLKTNIKCYRFNRLVFGVATSPFLLNAVINHMLQNVPAELETVACKLKESFYFDYCITSVNDENELNLFKNGAVDILRNAGFELKDWVNSTNLTKGNNSVLGLWWDQKDHIFCKIKNKPEDHLVTKRFILSVVNSVYDPLGFLAPALILLKKLIQICWEKKLFWDQEVSEDIKKPFQTWYKELNRLEECRIP